MGTMSDVKSSWIQILVRFSVIIISCLTTFLGIGLIILFVQGTDRVEYDRDASHICIAMGSMMAIAGFFGCRGAAKDNKPVLIGIFALLMMIILILDIVSIVRIRSSSSDNTSDNTINQLRVTQADGIKVYNLEDRKHIKSPEEALTFTLKVLIAVGIVQGSAFFTSFYLLCLVRLNSKL